MIITLFAQPYDITAHGFYFETKEEFDGKASTLPNAYGEPVEEFEIQFIDGEAIDAELAEAFGLNQANINEFVDAVETWDHWQKLTYIIVVGECGYEHLETDQLEMSPLKKLSSKTQRR